MIVPTLSLPFARFFQRLMTQDAVSWKEHKKSSHSWEGTAEEESFLDQLGDCIYFCAFAPETKIKDRKKGLSRLPDLINTYRKFGLPHNEEARIHQAKSFIEDMVRLDQKIRKTEKKPLFLGKLQRQYDKIKEALLKISPEMTHQRLEEDEIEYQLERFKVVKERSRELYPDDFESQANHCLRWGF